MAAPDKNVTWGGQVNSSGDERALYLEIASGEVYEAFVNNLIFKDTIMNRELRNAKSARFIHTGRMTSRFHVPGTPILGGPGDTGTEGNELPFASTNITVDDVLISSAFVDELDEVLADYDLRGPITRQIGQALAERYDQYVARVLFLASSQTAPITGEPGGFQIDLGAGNQLNAQALVDGFFEAAATLDERNAPKDGRYAVLSPRQYYTLISQVDTNILNRDYGNAQGNLNSGSGLYEIAGIKIRQSNNVPFQGGYGLAANTIADAVTGGGVTAAAGGDTFGERNPYGDGADFATAAGLIYHREAAACVTSLGPKIATTGEDTRTNYGGDLIVGRLAMGCKAVRTVVAGAFISDNS